MSKHVRIEDGVIIVSIPEWSPRARLLAMQLASYTLQECPDVKTREGVVNPISVEMGALDDDTSSETELRMDLEPEDHDRVLRVLDKLTRTSLVFMMLSFTKAEYQALEQRVEAANKALAENGTWYFCTTPGCDWEGGTTKPEACPKCRATTISGLHQHKALTVQSFALDAVLARTWGN